MALAEAALEELGLAPMWKRRAVAATQSAASADGAAAAQEAAGRGAAGHKRGESPAQLAGVAEADVRQRRAGGLAAPIGTSVGEPATELVTEPIAAPTTKPALEPQAAREASDAAPDDGSWFDPAPASEPGSGPALDEPALDQREGAAAGSDASIATLDWDELSARVADCRRCRLCEKRTNTVFGVGDREADWMLIGEAPGENEDRQGEPFVGQAGKLLDNMLQSLSLARGKNVYIANVIKCRPPGNRNPEPDEVARCEPYLQRQVALVKPKLIVALGRFAAQTLLKTDASIASLRGRVHAYEGAPVIVTYHPAYLLRSLPDKAKAWADLCLARDTYRSAVGDDAAAR